MNPSLKIIKWGIIGLGNIAHKFAEDVLSVKDAELYAVASRSQEKADAFASKYGVKKAYASYELLVKDTNLDAVYIATPHTFHKQNALLCLNYGIAVLCEKPFAMNAEEVSEMIQKAKSKNVLLMEALWTYFLPHYRFALKELQNKRFGNIEKLEANFGFYRAFDDASRLFNKNLGGGSLLDIGIYPIFAALSTLGMPSKISAASTKFYNGADSSCNISFEHLRGQKSYLKSTLLEDTSTEAIFYCEKGILKINKPFHAPSSISLIENGIEKVVEFEYTTNGYNYEIEHFNALLRAGKTESDIMTFKFSNMLINVLDTVRNLIELDYQIK